MHYLTMTHAKRWHGFRESTGTGPVYQNRYYCVPIQQQSHLLTVLRYVERNPLRAALVQRAEDWRWSSLSPDCKTRIDLPLSEWPIPKPERWVDYVNTPMTSAELEAIRSAVRRGRPIGDAGWSAAAAATLGLSLRERGRPKRHPV